MWTRVQIKNNAKSVMAKNYWMMLGITSVYLILGGMMSSAYSTVQVTYQQYVDYLPARTLIVLSVLLLGISLLSAAFGAFVTNPLEVGKNRYFMKVRLMPARFGDLFFAFGDAKRYYMNVVKTQFLRGLYTFLWSLLLVVPGIVKSYEYRMMPYIQAENPSLPSRRVFELSKQMTEGEKWNIFVLDLSFIGWSLLSAIACCIGVYFVQPYFEATYAELYEAMRAKVFDMGATDENELCNFWN